MFNPPITDLHGGFADVSNLLTILANPDQHQQRLDELIAAERAAKERIDALNKMAEETRRRDTATKAAEIVSNNRKTALDTREAEIEKREAELDRGSAISLAKRENAVSVRETAATRREAENAVMKKDYEDKLARIKGLADTLHH
jgi:hypothetical protein